MVRMCAMFGCTTPFMSTMLDYTLMQSSCVSWLLFACCLHVDSCTASDCVRSVLLRQSSLLCLPLMLHLSRASCMLLAVAVAMYRDTPSSAL